MGCHRCLLLKMVTCAVNKYRFLWVGEEKRRDLQGSKPANSLNNTGSWSSFLENRSGQPASGAGKAAPPVICYSILLIFFLTVASLTHNLLFNSRLT